MAKNQLKEDPKWPRKTIVIGGSAGALTMVMQIVQSLPVDLNIATLIVLHRKSAEENVLVDVLRAKTKFDVREVEDKDELLRGMMYVAPAEYHVLVERDGSLTLDDSEKVNYSRPSIDVSFESAAEIYRASLVCVLLSGANADGVDGIKAVRARGGKVVIQDPASAEFSYMPQQGMRAMQPDLVLTENNLKDLYAMLGS